MYRDLFYKGVCRINTDKVKIYIYKRTIIYDELEITKNMVCDIMYIMQLYERQNDIIIVNKKDIERITKEYYNLLLKM